jgi:hypothetical protein
MAVGNENKTVRDIRLEYLTRYKEIREDPFFVPRAMEQIIACLAELTTATRWDAVRNALVKAGPSEELVCYCLGDLSELNVAFQLAFFLLIANLFGIPSEKRLIFDPLHTEKDRQLLKLCGCTSLLHNEHALRKVHCRTLFYMPFAPFDLTDNVVRANWDSLDQVMIIGNPLKWVVDHRWGEKQHERTDVKETVALSPVSAASQHGLPRNTLIKQYTSRAPCVEAALDLASYTEVILWDDDLTTWTLEQAENEWKNEETEIEALEKEQETFQSEQQADLNSEGSEVENEGNDSDIRCPLPTGSRKRAFARHCLNASLATFMTLPADWPLQPPPRLFSTPLARSKL